MSQLGAWKRIFVKDLLEISALREIIPCHPSESMLKF
jgi:hypothetical protein